MASGDLLYPCPGQHIYDGVVLGKVYPAAILDEVKTFQFDPKDVLLASYPKSGRIWLEEVSWLLCNNANFDEAAKTNVRHRVPPLEIQAPGLPAAIEGIKKMTSPRLIGTFMYSHFYKDTIPATKPKVIVMVRNPKDVLTSYYHFYRMCAVTGFYKGSWEDFFKIARAKQLNLGDWFDHVLGWWNMGKDQENFLFVKYEDVQEDSAAQIRRIASFLGKSYSDDIIDQISGHCQLERMRKNPTTNMEDIPAYDQKISPFLRKGQIGDWKNYFTEEQNARFDTIYQQLVGPTGLQLRFE